MLDCGLGDFAPLQSAPPPAVVLCSHAHPDHARGLMALHQAWPQTPIYGSEVTAQLLPLNWLDRKDADTDFCHALPWRTPIEFADGLTAQLWPAGHLPGAACMLLTYHAPDRPYTLFYTGDFFLSNSRLVEGLPLEELRGLRPDVLVLEGSHGTARHPHRRQQENQLAERIHAAIAAGQSVLLPTPTLGLGQELLMLLRSHHHFTGKPLDIWVDPTVAAGCDAYLDLLSYFPSSVQNFARHQSLFWDERILPRVRRLTHPADLAGADPAIVLAHRGQDLSPYWKSIQPWVVFLPNQLGLGNDPQNHSWVQRLADQITAVDIPIQTYLLSSHCDGAGTTQLIHNLRPQHVVLIHGSPTDLTDLTGLEELQNRYKLHLPSAGHWLDLPIGETFIQPDAPESRYDGELTDTGDHIAIRLPPSITTDPRWNQFADTGLLEARWQGENLVLRGLSQQSLLAATAAAAIPELVECCHHCLHLRGRRCGNPASPLYGFRVTPDGVCPAFEPNSAKP